MNNRRKIIVDCDPGQDDAIALTLAFAAKDCLEVLGITTVAGNVQLTKTQRNARLICEMNGVTDIPVFAGCEKPMFRDLVTAEEYHGVEGLSGIKLYEPEVPLQEQHAVSFLIETLMAAADNSITIVGIGPLTNIAMALIQAPHIAAKIQEIVVMGGSYHEGGNVTAAAEFNFYVDPHAVEIVLNCGRPVTVFGLDVTHQAGVSKALRQSLDGLPATVGINILKASMDYFKRAYKDIYDIDEPPIHDVLTIAYLIEPALFKGLERNISIETNSELTMGASVVDLWALTGKTANAKWMTWIDNAGFYNLLLDRLSKIS